MTVHVFSLAPIGSYRWGPCVVSSCNKFWLEARLPPSEWMLQHHYLTPPKVLQHGVDVDEHLILATGLSGISQSAKVGKKWQTLQYSL